MHQMNLTSVLPDYLQPDHAEFLTGLGTPYTCDEYYLKVDFDQLAAERVIFISGILSQLAHLVAAVIPYLVSQKISFSLVKNPMVAKLVLNANFGEQHIGKLILIYLSADIDEDELVAALVILTTDFKGPAIPGHQHMGGTVYAKCPTSHSVNAFKKHPLTLKHNYLITALLKRDAKGDVYKALYLNKFMIPQNCVIKQARHCMWSDEHGRDVTDRLLWQHEVHQKLSSDFNIPKIIDQFKEMDNSYLVMQYVPGKSLNLVLEAVYQHNNWANLAEGDKIILLELLMDLFDTVARLHRFGFVHRDLTPGNLMLNKHGHLYMIDLELIYDLKFNIPAPVFTLGTEGFMSPEQWMGLVPTEKEDIYALGGFMIMCFTGLVPSKFELEKRSLLAQKLTELEVDYGLIKLILHCTEPDAGHRPSIDVLKKLLADVLYSLNWPEFSQIPKKTRFKSSLIYKYLSHGK